MARSTTLRRLRGVFSVLLIGLIAGLAGACAPLNALSAISDGTEQLETAERNGAAKYARYHFVKAQLLLNAAKERDGRGHHEIARRWAEEARTLAAEANRTAVARQELDRRRQRNRMKNQPTPPTKPTPPETKPGDKPATPPEKRPLQPPEERRQILPPSMGGGQ